MGRIMATLWRTSLRKGVFGGNNTWMTVFALVGVVRLARRLSGSVEETVFSGRLEPGERLVISHLRDETLG